MKYQKVRKLISLISSFSLLFQSLSPLAFVSPVYAQEATESALVEVTPAPDPTPEITPTITEEITPTPSVEPSTEITPDPTIINVPTEEPAPENATSSTDVILPEIILTPAQDATPTPEIIPEITPTLEPTPEEVQNNSPPSEQQPTPEASTPPQSETVSNSSEITPVPLPENLTIVSELEKAISPSPTLTTDKADYFPTETVHISGTGFLPNTSYTLHITSSDTPFVSYKVDVITDENGSFSYSYQLDGNYRPSYTVEVLDLNVKSIASVSFTDPVSITWPSTWDNYLVNGLPIYDEEKHGSNNDPSNGGTGVSPSSIDIASGAVYSGTDPGNQPSVQYLTSDSNYLFYRMRLAAEPLSSGGSSRHWDILLDTDHDGYKEYVIDLDHNANTFGLYYNDTNANTYDPTTDATSFYITSAETSGYVRQVLETYGNAIGGDDQYYLDFAVPKSAFGTSINEAITANLFYSTSASNTDPLQKDWMGFSGFIFGITKSVSVDGINFSSSQTVIAGTDVYFKVTLTNTGNANLTNVTIIDTLPAGFTYVAGSSTGVTTSNPTISSQTLTWSGPFTINAGGSITLTFKATTPSVTSQTTLINTASGYVSAELLGSATAQVVVNPATGTLTVQKTTNPAGDTTSFSINASSSTGGTITGGGAGIVTDSTDKVYTVTAGTYSVTEVVPTGWVETSNTCNNKVVAAGGNETCLITNTKNATLHVIKTVVNDNGGTKTASDFSFQVNSATASAFESDGQNDLTVTPGTTYNITEPSVTGYSTSYQGCSNIVISAGGEATCTIINEDIAPILHLRKIVVNDNGGNATESGFTLTADGTDTNDLSGTSPVDSTSSLKADTFTLSEAYAGGYTSSDWVCVGGTQNGNRITLGLNQEATCTITNNDTPPKLHLRKVIINDNGGTATSAAWTLTADGTAGNDLSGTTPVDSDATLQADTFTLSESGPSGYSASSWSCTDPGLGGTIISSNSISLYNGGESTCTITNDDQPATLIVKKVVVGSTADESNFSFSVNNQTAVSFETDGQNDLTVNAGIYNITEPAVTGFTTTYDNCTNVSLANGGRATCTITNTRDTGTLVVNKVIDIDGDLTTINDQTVGENWQFDVDGTGQDTTDAAAQYTGSVGSATFSNLKTGEYTIVETTQSGYDLFAANCGDRNGSFDQTDRVDRVSVAKGATTTCTFYNTPNGTIHGYKWSDVNGDGQSWNESKLSGWTINLYDWNTELGGFNTTPIKTMVTDSGETHFGWYWFEHLFPGRYKVCEESQSGWSQTYPATCHTLSLPDGNSNGFEEEVNATTGPVYKFGNIELATLKVYKFQDDDQDGYRDTGENGSEKLLSGWDIKLGQVEGSITTQTTGTDGSTTFIDIYPGSYNLSEVIKDGWFQSNIYCPRKEAESNENDLSLTFGAGDDVVCYIGNYTNPELQISKSNNALTNKTPGDSVTYRILINVLNSDVNNLVVQDLLPKGIVYRSGSYQVKINGLIIPITEPDYHSPGAWNIGNVKVGDEIELLYTADISGSQLPGTYLDLALAEGKSLAGDEVLALAQTEGYIDTNYVGTSVNIIKNQTSDQDYNVENKVEGQVLGVSTSLPATGANENWLIIALACLYIGLKLVRSSKTK